MHHFRVHLLMKLTYQTLPNDVDNYDDIQEVDTENAESETSPGCDNPNRKHWDNDCPWNEWYSAEDPVMGKLMFVITFFIRRTDMDVCLLEDLQIF